MSGLKFKNNNNEVTLTSFPSDSERAIGVPIQTVLYGYVKFVITSTAGTGNGDTFKCNSSRLYITQGENKVLFESYMSPRGHVLYIFDPEMNLVQSTFYDSYGQNNTNGITAIINNTWNPNYIYIITTYDAITNDSGFASTIKSKFNTDISKINQSRSSFIFIGTQNFGKTFYVKENDITRTIYAHIIKNNKISSFSESNSPINVDIDNAIIPIESSFNFKVIKGYTYYLTILVRHRGDGDSTLDRHSSIYCNLYSTDWTYCIPFSTSLTDINDFGKIISKTVSSVSSSSFNANVTIYFIISGQFSKGQDNQTIDLYYYDLYYKDLEGNYHRIACDGASDTSTFPAKPQESFIAYQKDGKTYYVMGINGSNVFRTVGAIRYSGESNDDSNKKNSYLKFNNHGQTYLIDSVHSNVYRNFS